MPSAWQRGLYRLWLVLSLVWAASIALVNGWDLFQEGVGNADIVGVVWWPTWADFRHYVEGCADPLTCLHAEDDFRLVYYGLPSKALIAARVLNALALALLIPMLVLGIFRVAGWVMRGFGDHPNSN